MSSTKEIDRLIGFEHSTISCPSARTFDGLGYNMPPFLQDLWSQVGWSSWQSGAFWLCNPNDFKTLLARIFGPLFQPNDSICFGYDAAGRYLHLWHRHHGILLVDTIAGDILVLGWTADQRDDGSRTVADHLLQTVSLAAPWLDRQLAETIRALNRANGALSYNEVYVFNSISTTAIPELSAITRDCAIDALHRRLDNLELLVVPDIDTPGEPKRVKPVATVEDSFFGQERH